MQATVTGECDELGRIAYTWVLIKNKQIQNISLVHVCKPESSQCNFVADV